MLRIRDLAATRTRYGYFRIYILLRREGWFVNHKRVYRLYREDGLSLRLKKPRRTVSAGECQEFCAGGRCRHQMTNRSPKMTANWVFASDHSRGGRFHS